jgi:serine O-acetyltransferase
VDESWKQTVDELIASYEQLGGLNNQDIHNMPSKRAVGVICEDLLRILFPGFHDDDAIHRHTIFDLTDERLSSVVKRLETQIRKSVRIGDPHRPTGRTKPILLKFCKDLIEIRRLLHTDIETAYEGDPAALSREEIILSYPVTACSFLSAPC